MKSIKTLAAVAALALCGAAFADSTHICQGNSCNGNDGGSGGGSVTNTATSSASIGPVTSTSIGTGIGVGGTANATGGNASVAAGAVTTNPTATATAPSVMKGGDVNINQEAARPAASAPANSLTSVGSDNCLGSASGSFGNGFFSIGGGSTKESVECNRRANGRRLQQLGLEKAAVALQCMNDEVRSAMKIAGTPCPQDEAMAATQPTTTRAVPERSVQAHDMGQLYTGH